MNGDNNLENIKPLNDTWKVRLIAEDFHRLMFDMEGVSHKVLCKAVLTIGTRCSHVKVRL